MTSTKASVWIAGAVVAATSALLAVTAGGEPAQAAGEDRKREPLVIAHRGASGDRPEHTLAAYEHAIDLGADYIEPDLVSTKDRVLVARHENEIGGTTDVATRPEFTSRQKTKVIDGVAITGWFTEDFTLTELKTLRAKERIPQLRPTNAVFDGLYEVPTLQEVIELAKSRGVGIYPETKHPTYFASIGLSLEEPLVATLKANGWADRKAPVFIQSFEVANLKQLNTMIDAPIVQLINLGGQPYDFVVSGNPTRYANMATPAGLREIATYADGAGPNKNYIVPRNAANQLLPPTTFVADAHKAGLVVHPWTFRLENEFLAEQHRQGNPTHPLYRLAKGNIAKELELFYTLGVDGVFTDNTDVGVAARERIFSK